MGSFIMRVFLENICTGNKCMQIFVTKIVSLALLGGGGAVGVIINK